MDGADRSGERVVVEARLSAGMSVGVRDTAVGIEEKQELADKGRAKPRGCKYRDIKV